MRQFNVAWLAFSFCVPAAGAFCPRRPESVSSSSAYLRRTLGRMCYKQCAADTRAARDLHKAQDVHSADRPAGRMVDVTDSLLFPLLGPRIRFLQHRGCLDPTANIAKHNTPAAAIEVLEQYCDEPWFAGLEMDICYAECPICTVGGLESGWMASHDLPSENSGDDHASISAPCAFAAYLDAAVPRLLEYGKRINVEVKGVVNDKALEYLACMVESTFQNVSSCADPFDYVIFTSCRSANLVLLGERGYRVGLFVHYLPSATETDEFEVLIEDGFCWANTFTTRHGSRVVGTCLQPFLILRLHASSQVKERQVKEWEERALEMRVQLWYTGISAEDACKLADLKYQLSNRHSEESPVILPAPADPPQRETNRERIQPLLVVIDDDLPFNPDRHKYNELYGRHSGVAWEDDRVFNSGSWNE